MRLQRPNSGGLGRSLAVVPRGVQIPSSSYYYYYNHENNCYYYYSYYYYYFYFHHHFSSSYYYYYCYYLEAQLIHKFVYLNIGVYCFRNALVSTKSARPLPLAPQLAPSLHAQRTLDGRGCSLCPALSFRSGLRKKLAPLPSIQKQATLEGSYGRREFVATPRHSANSTHEVFI